MNRLVIPLMLFVTAWGAAAAPQAHSFTVATFSINFNNRDFDRVETTLRSARADVVCLQETTPQSERHLRTRCAAEYPHMAFRAGRDGSDGFGMLSRSPLREVRFIKAHHGQNGVLVARVTLGGRDIQVASVHLERPKTREVESLAAVTTMFENVEAVHGREIRFIHQELAMNLPALVMGDFNSFSFFVAPRFLAAHGFTDSFAAVNAQPESHPTWRAGSGEHDWRFRIDFIFHSRELQTLESRVISSATSDHDLVVSRLRWVNSGEGSPKAGTPQSTVGASGP